MTLLLSEPLAAQNYQPRDTALLPAYCKYTQDFRERVPGGNNVAEIERLTALMGGVFIHMHHYCYGLVATNRATFFSRTPQERAQYLNTSLNEFDYVIQRAPPDFALLPEILTKKGENLIRLERGPQGLLDLQRAIEIKADYWPPYAAISDYFKETSQIAKAREWLEKGLSAAPDAKALVRRLADLDAAKEKRRTAGPGPDGKPAAVQSPE